MFGIVLAWYSCILAIVFSSLPGHQCGHAQHYQPRLCQHLEQLFSIGEIEYFQSERLDHTHLGHAHVVQDVHFHWTNENSRWISKDGEVTTTSGNNRYANLSSNQGWDDHHNSLCAILDRGLFA